MSLSLLTIIDAHLSKSGVSTRKDDFRETQTSKLEQIKILSRHFGVAAQIYTGDMFHFKDKEHNDVPFMTWLSSVFNSDPTPKYTIIGNHDLRFDRLDSVPEMAIGNLFINEVFSHLTYTRFKTDVIVDVYGFDFDRGFDPKQIQYLKRMDADFTVLVAHCFVSKDGQAYGEPCPTFDDFAHLGCDLILLGHDHSEYDVVKWGNTQFVRHGSLVRGSMHRENLDRNPQVGLLTFEKGQEPQVNYIPLQVLPSREIFDLDKRSEKKFKEEEIQTFVQKLLSLKTYNTGSIAEMLRQMGLSKETISTTEAYLLMAGVLLNE